jgi:hypothetical protein
MEQCSFHLVPYFGECSSGVTLNFKFVFWELHETFPVFFNVAGLKFMKHFFFLKIIAGLNFLYKGQTH